MDWYAGIGRRYPLEQAIVSYEYDAFGGLKSVTGTLANEFRFTGEQWDDDAGLYYLRARYYDPSTGRFISRDPFGGVATSPLSHNRYVYVQNNPINLVDPTGMSGEGNNCGSQSLLSTLQSWYDSWIRWRFPATAAANDEWEAFIAANPTASRSDLNAKFYELFVARSDVFEEAMSRLPAGGATLRSGQLAHAAAYSRFTGNGVRVNQAIRGPGGKPINRLRPDVVDYENKVVIELKSGGVGSAERQVQRYVTELNNAWGTAFKGFVQLIDDLGNPRP